jgi:ABC-type sulfate transport system substrate-binding protein
MKHLVVRCIRDRDWRCRAGTVLGLLLLIAVVIYGRIARSSAPTPNRMVVYALSTQEEALTESIFPAFEEAWEAKTGRNLTIQGVFGPSGTLAGQINLGAPADVALLSNAQHVTQLKVGQRVRRKTQLEAIGYTPMVIVTRPGNPAGISEFADLAQPGLQLLHPDPRSSSAGEWAVLAEYGSAFLESNDQAAAVDQLEAIWRNLRLLGPSARATMTLFELGAGDAFVTYEHDALLAQERGIPLEVVVPPRTILASHVAVIVDDNVSSAQRPVVRAFVDFLLSDAGQQILRRYHVRPAEAYHHLFPEPNQAFAVEDLGGWTQAYTRLVEGLWRREVESRLDLEPAPKLLDAGE